MDDAVEGWRIVIGADDAGYAYKEQLVVDLLAHPGVATVDDIGVAAGQTTPYPTIGLTAAQLVHSGVADRAVLVCGTGLGMAIAANTVSGVRAVTAHDSYSVERSILSNDAQVLTLGARVIGLELARRLVAEWLTYRFDSGSGSAAKLDLIRDYEQPAHTRQ
jgi:ribose 5-phosphate isomerase B